MENQQQRQPSTTTTTLLESFEMDSSPFELKLLGVFGDDLTIVNAARISFNTEHKELTEGDKKLIKFLAQEEHMSPFRHVIFRFQIRAPEFVMRQLYKHVVGIEMSSTHPVRDHAWNELSGRYKPYTDIYCPPTWYEQHQTAKQCSGNVHEQQDECNKVYSEAITTLMNCYQKLLDLNVAKEQARMLIPMSVYSSVVMTCSFQAVFNFIHLRDSPHAQLEIRLLAQAMTEIVKETLPNAYNALFEQKNKK